MVLIKNFIDYHDKGDFERDSVWALHSGPRTKITRVNYENIYYDGGIWQIDFQYTLKIVFTDGTEMVFTGGPRATDKKNESGIDLVTFIQNYIDNNYELPTNDNYIDLDDIII